VPGREVALRPPQDSDRSREPTQLYQPEGKSPEGFGYLSSNLNQIISGVTAPNKTQTKQIVVHALKKGVDNSLQKPNKVMKSIASTISANIIFRYFSIFLNCSVRMY
jgi:hypothetical protein